MNSKLLIALVSLSVVFAFSCKKKEVGIPGVVYYKPYENQVFNFDDTISVHCLVSDEIGIESVKLVLVNSDFSPIGNAFFYYPGSSEFELETDYPIPPATIRETDNYLLVVADNGTKFKNKYLAIHVNPLEKELENVIVLSRPSDQQIMVSTVDPTNGNIEEVLNVNGSYAGSALDSDEHQLYLAGKEILNLQAYGLSSYELEWEIAPDPFIPMHNAGCLHFYEVLFLANNFYSIKAYTAWGQQVFTANVMEDEKPGRLFRFNEFVFCDMQSKSNGTSHLVTWYVNSSAEKQRLFTNFEVVDYAAAFDNGIFLAVNSLENSSIKLYDPESNVITDLVLLPNEILSMVKTGEGEVLIGAGPDVFLYSYPENYPEVVLPGLKAYRIKFESLSRQLYVVGANAIDVFNYPQLQHLQQIPLSDSIFDIHFHYNK